MTAPTKPGETVVYRAKRYLRGTNRIECQDFPTRADRKFWLGSSAEYRLTIVRILPARPKLHGFEWALKQMKAGKRVRRAGWNNSWFLTIESNGHFISLLGQDLLADDWQLAPTEAP